MNTNKMNTYECESYQVSMLTSSFLQLKVMIGPPARLQTEIMMSKTLCFTSLCLSLFFYFEMEQHKRLNTQ